MLDRKQTLPSVQDDWRAWLPRQKAEVFDAYVEGLETLYLMFSVALNEAIEMRRSRMQTMAYRVVCVTPALCTRLADCLGALLRALGEHAKHYGTTPNTVSLDPSNFHGPKEQRAARMSDLLSRVLLTQRSQFLHKISTLGEMASDIGKGFRLAAENLSGGLSTHPDADWQVVDAGHYDLNTCLRETIILLKSFLLVLPEDQIAAFQKTVRSQMSAPEPAALSDERFVGTGRMTSVGGE